MRNTLSLTPWDGDLTYLDWMVITCTEIQTTRQRRSCWATCTKLYEGGRRFAVGISALFNAQRCDNKTGRRMCPYEGSGFHLASNCEAFSLKPVSLQWLPHPGNPCFVGAQYITTVVTLFGTSFFCLYRSILDKTIITQQTWPRNLIMEVACFLLQIHGAKEMR